MEGKCTRGTKHVEIAGRMEWRISSSFQDSRNLISSVFEWKEEGGRESRVNGEWKEFVIAGSRSKKSMKPIRGHKSWVCEEGGKINVLANWR